MRRRFLIGLCGAAFLAAGCSSEAPVPAVLPEVPSLAPEDFSGSAAGQMRTALEALEAAPEDAVCNGELGMLLDAYGRTAAAAAFYERAQVLDPAALRWRYYLGAALLSQGEPQRAIVAFRDAAETDPDFVPARRALADALYASDQLAESRKLYEDILAQDAEDARALYGIGRILWAEGNAAGAVAKIERAVELAPHFGAAHYELALAYRDAGRNEDSRRAMERYEADCNTTPDDDPLRAQVEALRVEETEAP